MTYTIVQTEKGFCILKGRVRYLDGMQLRFLYDLKQRLVPDLDVVPRYFPSLKKCEELVALGLIRIHPQRPPETGEKRLMVSGEFLYYGIRASVFTAALTDKGEGLLEDLICSELFSECMIEMDEQMAENLLKGELHGL